MATTAIKHHDYDDDREDSFIILENPNPSSLAETENEELSSTLSEEISLVRNENASLREDLQKNSDLIKKQQSVFQAWKEDKERIVELYKNSYEEYKRTCEQLQQQNVSLSSTLEEYQIHLKEKEKLITKLGEELQQLDTALKNKVSELEQEQAQKDQLKCECEALTKMVNKLQIDVLRLTRESDCLSSIKDEMQKRLEVMEKKLRENSIIVEETENFTLVHRPDSLIQSQSHEPIISSPQEAILQEEQMRTSLLAQQLAEERLQVFNLQKQLEKKESFVNFKETKPQDKEAKESQTSITLEEFSEERATSIIITLQDEVTTLQNLLKLERQKRDEEKSHLKELEQKIQELSTQNTVPKEIFESESGCQSRQCHAFYTSQAKSYQEKLDEMTAHCLDTKQKVEKFKEENEKLKAELTHLKEEKNLLQAEKEKANSDIEQLKQYVPMAEDLPIIKGQLEKTQKELEEMKALYDETKKNNEELQNLLTDIFNEEEKSKSDRVYEWQVVEEPSAGASSPRSLSHHRRKKYSKQYKH